MALDHFHVVHVGLPVFDIALVVASDHPLLVSAPDHRTDRAIVSLQNGFKVKRQSVPQGELTA
jgi:hypothetical protein